MLIYRAFFQFYIFGKCVRRKKGGSSHLNFFFFAPINFTSTSLTASVYLPCAISSFLRSFSDLMIKLYSLSVSARWYLIFFIVNPSLTIFYSAGFQIANVRILFLQFSGHKNNSQKMFYHSLRVYFNFYLFCCIAVRTKSLLVNLLVELTSKSSETRMNTGFYLSKDFTVGNLSESPS